MLSTFDNNFYVGRKGGPPLNIAYLASLSEQEEVEYEVIDGLESNELTQFKRLPEFKLRGLALESIISSIDPKTDVIGITSMFTTEWMIVRELTILIKEKFPEIIIILGGEHATADAFNIIRFEESVDICFLGEAETSFVEFLNIENREQIQKIPGIIFRNKEENVVKNEKAPRLTNIDHLRPSWKKINVDYYLDNKLSYSELGNRTMPIVSSRGCPYQCTFCSNVNMWGTRYVTRSVDEVIKELSHYIHEYKTEHFDFIDLATSVNRVWFKKLLERMISDLPPFSWEMTVGTRSEILDEEILDLLYRSGSTVLSYAPETGSISMAKKIKKRINHEKMYSSIRQAVDRGFIVKANVIIGMPGESVRELVATLLMSLKLGWLGVRGVTVLTYQPFLGTEMTKDLYQEKSGKEYLDRIIRLTGKESAATVNILGVFSNPVGQFYTFLSNAFIVLSFLMACLRKPKVFLESWRNISSGKPIGAIEVALHSVFHKV